MSVLKSLFILMNIFGRNFFEFFVVSLKYIICVSLKIVLNFLLRWLKEIFLKLLGFGLFMFLKRLRSIFLIFFVLFRWVDFMVIFRVFFRILLRGLFLRRSEYLMGRLVFYVGFWVSLFIRILLWMVWEFFLIFLYL